MRRRIIIVSTILASAALAQNPAEGMRTPTPVPPLLQQYDFGAQVKELQAPDGVPAHSVKPRYGSPSVPAALPKPLAVPKDSPPKDVPLSQSAQEAANVSERWRGEGTPPAVGADGRVLYSYGAGLPTVVCAPLRVCIIELQAGEKVVGEPHIGDSVRWNISPAMYGTGDQATSIIVLKPQSPGLDTSLLITTDRRAYYLRLVSKPEEYVARVAFAYPEDESSRKWQQQIAAQHTQEKLERRSAETPPAVVAADKLNFDYRIKSGDDHIRPRRVFDDGTKTYIQMSAEIRHREAPVLLIIGADGKGEMTNYRVKDQTYIVDRLFDRANLVLGSGKKAQKVEITREPKG
jgi:type IV secretion system protein VirB9